MVSSDYYVEDNSNIENKKLDAAKNNFAGGRYNDALNLYLGMLNMGATYKLYFEIGRCYYKLNNYLAAEEYFKKSISMEDFKNSSYLYLGNIFFKRHDVKNAIENWVCAYAYKPYDESVCLNLATSYFSLGLKYQAIFYYSKYLKYARNTETPSYKAIKSSIEKCRESALESMQKGQIALNMADKKTAISCLAFATTNYPIHFDINYLLGRTYMEENDYMHALVYLKQALCIDNNSLDTLQKLAAVFLHIGDYTAAYCTLKRLTPFVLGKQTEYLKTMRLIKELEESFDSESYRGHKEWADRYYENNNYPLALMEYENCAILNEDMRKKLQDKIDRIKSFINPEERIIKSCLELGNQLFSSGERKEASKYFSKILLLANEDSTEYRIAKSRMNNV